MATQTLGPWFNIKRSYQYRKFHCVDETVIRLSCLHNGISYTGKMISLYLNQGPGYTTPEMFFVNKVVLKFQEYMLWLIVILVGTDSMLLLSPVASVISLCNPLTQCTNSFSRAESWGQCTKTTTYAFRKHFLSFYKLCWEWWVLYVIYVTHF